MTPWLRYLITASFLFAITGILCQLHCFWIATFTGILAIMWFITSVLHAVDK